jgi:hypothetical protein
MQDGPPFQNQQGRANSNPATVTRQNIQGSNQLQQQTSSSNKFHQLLNNANIGIISKTGIGMGSFGGLGIGGGITHNANENTNTSGSSNNNNGQNMKQ